MICFSSNVLKRSLTSWNFSFSSSVTVPTPSGLQYLIIANFGNNIEITQKNVINEPKSLEIARKLTDYREHAKRKMRKSNVLMLGQLKSHHLPCLINPLEAIHACGILEPYNVRNIHLIQRFAQEKTIPIICLIFPNKKSLKENNLRDLWKKYWYMAYSPWVTLKKKACK